MDTRTPLIWSGVVAIILVSAYIAIVGLPPKRPSTVPDNAVFVAGEKTGWWQVCFATDLGGRSKPANEGRLKTGQRD
jgi:hypothetical protein